MSIMTARDHTLSYKKSKSWLWCYSSYSRWIGMTFNEAAATVLLIMLIILCTGAVTATEELECPKALFSFGASAADTGNQEAAFPFTYAPQTTLPYGETFFHHPANRYSNGRLIIDFYAQALKFPFLSPYLQSVGSDSDTEPTSLLLGQQLRASLPSTLSISRFKSSSSGTSNREFWESGTFLDKVL
ncbi:hypothetical protein BDL97_11G005700 [Sphagnum fallax]|nr:hypothetical protein BDL97_11G005700 [Sphagnum fallax]